MSRTAIGGPQFEERCPTPNVLGCAQGDPRLEVNVIFTSPEATRSALKAADRLAQGLDARIRFLVAQVVPLRSSLDSPPVSIPFTERRFMRMALECRGDAGIGVQVYLCRDRLQCLLRALRPRSLVIIGKSRRWWPTPERKLARVLQSSGHRVILVEGRR